MERDQNILLAIFRSDRNGNEETILCPKCLDQRGHGSRFDGAVAGIQPDIFD